MLNIRRVMTIFALSAALALPACHKKGSTDSGGGNAPAPAPSVTPAPSPAPNAAATYNVYNDAGGVLGDPQVLLFTGGSLTIQELATGAPEGTKFLRASNGVPGGFWGVTLDKNDIGTNKDLSAFSSGSLKFWIRVNRVVTASERLLINLTDSGNKTQSVLLGTAQGFNGASTDWQQVSVPISSYTQIDKTKIKVPFAIAIDSPSGTGALEFDIDDVRWSAS